MSDKNVLIQVKDLKKAFGTNQVLDGITTDICQGEVVAVIGPSGSGIYFPEITESSGGSDRRTDPL